MSHLAAAWLLAALWASSSCIKSYRLKEPVSALLPGAGAVLAFVEVLATW